jgi:hypothetical protein
MLITDEAQVTGEWLQSVLDKYGVEITSFSKTSSQPFGATIVWLDVQYAGETTLPTAFLLKIDGPGTLAGGREVEFYTKYAGDLTARCFDAVFDAEQRAYHLLLANVSATHYSVEREAPPTRAESERMIDTLALIHSKWWNKVEFDYVDGDLLAGDSVNFSGFVDFMGERLTPERSTIYECILDRLPGLLRERLKRSGTTLVHDDAHTWNFMQPRDPVVNRALLLDWQQWGRSVGAHDVSYTITLFWYPDHRRRLEQTIVRRYYDRLLEHGVAGYSWDECWYDYRLYALRNMLVPLWAWNFGHWAPHRWMQMEKSLFAYSDLNCVEILD